MLPSKKTVLEEAADISSKRELAYGSPAPHFKSVAVVWSEIIGCEISPDKVPLCMAALKIIRQAHLPKRDNMVDAAGYLHLTQIVGDSDE